MKRRVQPPAAKTETRPSGSGSPGLWTALAALSAVLLVASLAACKKKEVASEGAPGPEAAAAAAGTSVARDTTIPKPGPVVSAQVTLKIGASSGLRDPRGVGVDGNGNVYVVDSGNARVVKFDPSGKELLSFGKKGSEAGQFVQPWVLAISQGNVLVLDSDTTWIQVFSPAGKFLARLGGPDLAFYHPAGLAVAPDGTALVVDTGGNRVVPIKPDGHALPSVTSAGKDKLSQPTDLCVDAHGGLHVYQTATARTPSVFYHLTPAGELTAKWIAPDAPSTRDTPRSAMASDGRLYVTDPQSQQIRVYDADGRTYHLLRLEGPDAAPFRVLTGIALDAQGNVYAADGGANLVYRLKV